MLLELLVVVVEVPKLLRQDVGVWRQIEGGLPMLFLHPHDIVAEPIFPRDLVRVRELIDLLILVQAFVLVGLEASARPKQVPVM